MSLEARHRDVLERIAAAAKRSPAAPNAAPRLVAVTKGRPIEDLQALYDLGQRDFGENRADALLARRAAMPPDARWHFIGHIQRNKVKLLAEGAHLVHSVDRAELVDAWPPHVPLLVQVDFTGIAGRSGAPPDEAAFIVERARAAGLDVRGLATLPPREGDARAAFQQLRALGASLGLVELSMGMSADFEAAIEEGATMVRVGRALFGED